MRTSRVRGQGFGLLEVILVFALVIGAGAVVFAVFGPASTDAQVNDQLSQVGVLRANIESVYVNHQYDGLTTTTAINAKMVPAAMLRDSTTTPTSVWGGEVAINGTTASRQFTIALQNVPDEACAKLGIRGASQFDGVTINAVPVKQGARQAVDPGAIGQACQAQSPATVTLIGGVVRST